MYYDGYPEQRNLDGVYFRIRRDDEWQSICWTDLTEGEREEIVERRAENATIEEQLAWWKGMADVLTDALREVGDELDLVSYTAHRGL